MYPDMANLLNPAESGDYRLEIFEVGDKDFMAAISGVSAGRYVRLRFKGDIVMSNTQMEKRTNSEFVCHAHGDVLIGGLGIGMIILAIQNKEKVNSVTIIEKSQDVIDMVANQLPFNSKVRIICDDVFTYKPDRKYDCIYMDIWNYINSDVYQKEMKPLKRKYGHYLKSLDDSPKRFNKCWAEWQAKNDRRLY